MNRCSKCGAYSDYSTCPACVRNAELVWESATQENWRQNQENRRQDEALREQRELQKQAIQAQFQRDRENHAATVRRMLVNLYSISISDPIKARRELTFLVQSRNVTDYMDLIWGDIKNQSFILNVYLEVYFDIQRYEKNGESIEELAKLNYPKIERYDYYYADFCGDFSESEDNELELSKKNALEQLWGEGDGALKLRIMKNLYERLNKNTKQDNQSIVLNWFHENSNHNFFGPAADSLFLKALELIQRAQEIVVLYINKKRNVIKKRSYRRAVRKKSETVVRIVVNLIFFITAVWITFSFRFGKSIQDFNPEIEKPLLIAMIGCLFMCVRSFLASIEYGPNFSLMLEHYFLTGVPLALILIGFWNNLTSTGRLAGIIVSAVMPLVPKVNQQTSAIGRAFYLGALSCIISEIAARGLIFGFGFLTNITNTPISLKDEISIDHQRPSNATVVVPKAIPVKPMEETELESKKYQNVAPSKGQVSKTAETDNGFAKKISEKPTYQDAAKCQRADDDLNSTYNRIINRLPKNDKEKLRNEQRMWIKRRDDAAKNNPNESESIKLKMTLDRTAELDSYR